MSTPDRSWLAKLYREFYATNCFLTSFPNPLTRRLSICSKSNNCQYATCATADLVPLPIALSRCNRDGNVEFYVASAGVIRCRLTYQVGINGGPYSQAIDMLLRFTNSFHNLNKRLRHKVFQIHLRMLPDIQLHQIPKV